MTDQVGRERRRHPRIARDATVIVIHSADVRSLRARDLSAGGAYLLAEQAPPPAEPLRVEFDLGPGRHFAVAARLVRDETQARSGSERGFAVEFEASSEVLAGVGRALSGD